MATGSTTTKTGHSNTTLLSIYLNDHLAGICAVQELLRRSLGAHQGSPIGEVLTRLMTEVGEDRIALVTMMNVLGVPVRGYKVYAAWVAEKIGRLKLNGCLLRRSPLSSLVELEGLRLGVEANAAAWRTLRELADHVDRLDASRLDEMISRAVRQADVLEELRMTTAIQVFGLE